MRARMLIVGGLVLFALLVLLGFAAFTIKPLASSGFGVGTSDAASLSEWPVRPVTVQYGPQRHIYLRLLLLNEGPVAITVDGVRAEPPGPSGYSPAWLAIPGSDGMPRDAPAEPFTLKPKAARSVVIVYAPTTDCARLPTDVPREGTSGATFLGAELRFRLLGIVSRTQFVDVGDAFFVPQPSRADCLAAS